MIFKSSNTLNPYLFISIAMDNITSSAELQRQLKIIHIAFCAGMIMFFPIAIFMAPNLGIDFAPITLLIVNLIIAPLSILLGSILVKKQQHVVNTEENVTRRLGYLRGIYIIKWVTTEGPLIFALLSYMISTHWIFLAFATALLAWLILQRPVVTEE